jgi:hypothetical protein
MANGLDWEGLTAKPIEELTVDEKLIVLIGEQRDTRKEVNSIKEKVKPVARLDMAFKVIVWSSFAWVPALGWFIYSVLIHLAR